MIWLAKTSAADGIAIVVFATVIFLILFGIVSLVKWILRLMSGRPNPARMEAVVLVLETEICEENEEPKDYENIRIFAFYLHSKLAGKKIGQLADANHEDSEVFLHFVGPDASGIWNVLEGEVKEYSPTKPKRVILERAKRNGGAQVLDQIPWQPDRELDFQIPHEVKIPEKWLRLSNIGHLISVSGIVGLFGWKALRLCLGMTENEFMDSGLGMLSAYLVGVSLIFGLSLSLICSIRIKAITRAAGFFDVERSISNTLKYVLLIVIAVFGAILLLI